MRKILNRKLFISCINVAYLGSLAYRHSRDSTFIRIGGGCTGDGRRPKEGTKVEPHTACRLSSLCQCHLPTAACQVVVAGGLAASFARARGRVVGWGSEDDLEWSRPEPV